MVNKKVKKTLNALVTEHGVYEVLKGLEEVSRKKCETDYAYNLGAVIHKDTASLYRAVADMKSNHSLRSI